jgi:hypothetical protein
MTQVGIDGSAVIYGESTRVPNVAASAGVFRGADVMYGDNVIYGATSPMRAGLNVTRRSVASMLTPATEKDGTSVPCP